MLKLVDKWSLHTTKYSKSRDDIVIQENNTTQLIKIGLKKRAKSNDKLKRSC